VTLTNSTVKKRLLHHLTLTHLADMPHKVAEAMDVNPKDMTATAKDDIHRLNPLKNKAVVGFSGLEARKHSQMLSKGTRWADLTHGKTEILGKLVAKSRLYRKLDHDEAMIQHWRCFRLFSLFLEVTSV
jgi:hypothetical protein